jgi:hypothetical protein
MKHDKARPIVGTIFLMLALTTTSAVTPATALDCENEIRIAPETLNLRSGGTVVTVHTDVPYWAMDVYSVYLSGVVISTWKADDRGFFVAKFLMDDIKAIDGLVLNDYNTFQLIGATLDGELVCGEADVMVIDRGPASPNRHHGSSTD